MNQQQQTQTPQQDFRAIGRSMLLNKERLDAQAFAAAMKKFFAAYDEHLAQPAKENQHV